MVQLSAIACVIQPCDTYANFKEMSCCYACEKHGQCKDSCQNIPEKCGCWVKKGVSLNLSKEGRAMSDQKKTAKMTNAFSVKASDSDVRKLHEVAEAYGIGNAEYIRALIRAAYRSYQKNGIKTKGA